MDMSGSGGGCEYSCSGSLHFIDSLSSSMGRYGNLFVIDWRFIGSFCSWMNL